MRKFLSIILALSIIFSMSAMVVSADSYVYELGTPTAVNDTTVTIPVIFNPPIEMYAVDVVKVAFTLNGCTLKSVTSKIDGYSATVGATAFNLTGSSEGALYDAFIAGDRVVAVITVEKVTDNATIVIDPEGSDTGDSYDGTFGPGCSVSPALTLWPTATETIATEYTTEAGKTYTSVPNKSFKDIAVADLSNFGGDVTVTYDGGKNSSFTKAFTFGGLGTGSGSASFDVAVVGVPFGITVTGIDVVIK